MTETNTSNKQQYRLRLIAYAVLAAVLVGLDQWSKHQILAKLPNGQAVTVLPNILQFRSVENTGAAFSVLSGKTLALTVATAVILLIGVVLLALEKIPGRWNQIAVVLMLSGGAGNLIDRIHRHSVVDFIEVLFTDFAVFNVADCCVTVGAFLLIISTLLSFFKDLRNDPDKE